ncbi:putative prefoldin subunit 4 [Porphyridium purpureum]|uniref:Prefoldin subunit 4 n=1 Tax=Porphyridium purpureum TaxID=35688 RepID=A0A5J4Z6U2_PORPP|nr:putative prefoldin subunit 4 [Porphyridium purpureum]|eukprot:POR9855..scf295_1
MRAAVVAPQDERDTTVTRSDQNDINRFARLLNERIDTGHTLRMRRELLRLHDDAADELILADDDELVQHVVGDVFCYAPKSEVEARIQEQKEKLEAEIADLDAQLAAIVDEMQKLKSHLYAKFGNTINLEES